MASSRSREEWDVVVVGAGPAGCAAAAAAQQADPSASILLLDKAEFPRDKPCGDGIAHEVDVVLGQLGFDVDAIFDGTPAVHRLRLESPAGVRVDRPLPDPVHVVPREVFDARLVQDIRRRAIELRRHAVREIVAESAHVDLDAGLRAKVVIGADGAESVVRRAIGVPMPRPDRVALAIRGYAPELPGQADTQLITMTSRHWPAYAWSFPIGDGRANVGYGQLLGDRPLNRAQMVERMTELLPGVHPHPDRLRAHRLPLSSGRPRIPDGRVLLVGDAQSLINPLTGEGIFYAVVSGALAGRAAVGAVTRGADVGGADIRSADVRGGADAGRMYRGLVASGLGRHFRHTSALSRLGRWPGLIDAGMRAAASDQRAFDDLVRFGLADGLLTARLLTRLRPR